jgi:uncharacterized protein (TIGR00255 family)
MTTYSMTGFGQAEVKKSPWHVTIEMKSVNHRFKEVRFRLPQSLQFLENDLKTELDSNFRRGSFDIWVNFSQSSKGQNSDELDWEKIRFLMNEFETQLPQVKLQVNPLDFLKNDFLKPIDEKSQESLSRIVLDTFRLACLELKKARLKEGEKLVTVLRNQLDAYENGLSQVDGLRQKYPEMIKEKLEQKIQEKLQALSLDPQRMALEILFYLEKYEIDEEISRAKIHLHRLREVLAKNEDKGRQIDFLLQELGRETNTIGSKSASSEISQLVVDMKVQLEKVREQALNLE